MDWALMIKTDPAKSAKIASKNWLFHGVEVKRDIATEEADWSQGDYFGSGDETAMVLTTLVPLESLAVDDVMEYIIN